MGVRNFDASRITANNQSKALYGYYNTVVNSSTVKNSVLAEQPSTQMAGVLISRHLGACPCASTDYLVNPFQNPVNNGSANNNGS